MKEVKGLFLASFSGAFCVVAAMGANQDDAGSPPVPALSADTFEEREQAEEAIWRKGPEAVNLLKALTLSNDPEQAWRARQILRWVDLEITPETPAEIRELIESYLKAPNAQQREKIYDALLTKEAYVQLFRLPRHVSNKEVARELAERVSELAGRIAVEKILEGKEEEALAVLESAKNNEISHLRWVSLASAMGLREELWADLSSEDQMRFARWEGDLDLVRSLASPDHEVQLTLQLLEGEALPYLKKQSARRSQAGIRTRVAMSFWNGEEESEDNLKLVESLVSELNKNGAEESEDVLVLLAQMGYREEVLPHLEKEYPVEMFRYYDKEEKVEDAFRVLGLEVGKLIPEEWIEEALSEIEDEFDPSGNEGCKRLVTVGHFMVERGMDGEARRIFDALYDRMDKEEIHEMNHLLSHLGGNQSPYVPGAFYPEYAIQKAEKREEEVFLPESFLNESFSAEEKPFLLYHFLDEREVEMTDWQKVRAVFAAFGRDVDFLTMNFFKYSKS